MRKLSISIAAMLLVSWTGFGLAADTCTTLKTNTILYSAGHYLAGMPITVGVDPYGYNYQAHMFAGSYANAYLGGLGFPPYDGDDAAYLAINPAAANSWVWPYRKDELAMKWNDAWLSNMDCDGDLKLDRHYGFSSYIGSGAWETNHMKGTYSDGEKDYMWNYFVKIVAAPADAYSSGGNFVAASGKIIGPVLWGEFATIQEIYNDSGTGDHGISYLSPSGAGLGKYGPQD